MVKVEIDGILAAEFCQDFLAPVNAAYADEKAGILGEVYQDVQRAVREL